MSLRPLFVVAVLLAGAGWAHAQSLAEVARAEEARRKDVTKPSKVYTNDSLKPDFTKPTPPEGSAPAPGDSDAPPATGSPAEAGPAATPAAAPAAASAATASAAPERDQAYWSARITEARSQAERSRAFAAALQNRIDMLWADFVNRDNPVERSAIEQDRIKALAELDRVNREIEEQNKAVAAIEDEARRAGVPPGWLRPS